MSSRDPSYFVGRPVESMQYMLRVLSQGDNRLIPVTPDGIYGQNTMAAVIAFQRANGLPSTGVMNLTTWEALVRQSRRESVRQDFAEPIRPILNPGQVLSPGQANYHAALAQVMLRTLASVYGGIPMVQVNGVMDAPTVAAVRRFQSLGDLPVTGAADRSTWQSLARQCTMAAGNGAPEKGKFGG